MFSVFLFSLSITAVIVMVIRSNFVFMKKKTLLAESFQELSSRVGKIKYLEGDRPLVADKQRLDLIQKTLTKHRLNVEQADVLISLMHYSDNIGKLKECVRYPALLEEKIEEVENRVIADKLFIDKNE
jgi:hypothetical protein